MLIIINTIMKSSTKLFFTSSTLLLLSMPFYPFFSPVFLVTVSLLTTQDSTHFYITSYLLPSLLSFLFPHSLLQVLSSFFLPSSHPQLLSFLPSYFPSLPSSFLTSPFPILSSSLPPSLPQPPFPDLITNPPNIYGSTKGISNWKLCRRNSLPWYMTLHQFF